MTTRTSTQARTIAQTARLIRTALFLLPIVLAFVVSGTGCLAETDVAEPVEATTSAVYESDPPVTTPPVTDPPPPCGSTTAGTCGGTCPNAGEVCQYIGAYASCGCMAPKYTCRRLPSEEVPLCGGTCPPGQVCSSRNTRRPRDPYVPTEGCACR